MPFDTMSCCQASIAREVSVLELQGYELLCANLALNGCKNVEAYNLALYDRAGSMRLASPERQEVPIPLRDGQPDYARIANAAALTFEVVDDEAGDVRSVVLDELALEQVALIKVDTQGADLRVLRGAEATIRRHRPVILFEWERDLGKQHGTLLENYHAFFAGLDYDLTVLQETMPSLQEHHRQGARWTIWRTRAEPR